MTQQDPASQNNGKIFTATVSLPLGNNGGKGFGEQRAGNISTKNYSVIVASGAAKTFTYDNNGNCTGYTCGSTNVTYQWDAEDRLVVISDNQGNSSTFTYDGLSRRVKEDIYMSGEFATTLRFLWSGKELCEERDSSGGTVTKRFFADGEFVSGNKVFFAKDHLGSVREVMSSNGTTILSRYDYDPYGRRTKVGGFFNYGDFGFTGHYYHAASGLYLALYRAYDADTGRWLNRDPIGERGGINLYGYVFNDPINKVDPDGRILPILLWALGGAIVAATASVVVRKAVEADGDVDKALDNAKKRDDWLDHPEKGDPYPASPQGNWRCAAVVGKDGFELGTSIPGTSTNPNLSPAATTTGAVDEAVEEALEAIEKLGEAATIGVEELSE